MSYLLLFHSNNGYVNVLQCYVLYTLPVLYIFVNSLMMAVMINWNIYLFYLQNKVVFKLSIFAVLVIL